MTRKAPRPPFSALSLLQQEVNELFGRLALTDGPERVPSGEWSPSIDVYEARERLVVVVEVPGLGKEALRVACRGRTLIISGERRARRTGAGISFLCLERPHGRFERAIPLEVPVDVKGAQATLSGGVLTVSLPRLKERRGRETVIPIEWEQAG